MRLKQKVGIVTGGAAGIGEGICTCMAREGADVVIADIDIENAERTAAKVKEIGRRSLVIKTDVRNASDCEDLVTKTLEEFGRLDILVCNAGISGIPAGDGERPLDIENITEEDWDLVHEINLKGVFLCNRAVAKHFKKQKYGKIINMSSTSGRRGSILLAYCSSKGAVLIFSQAVALQLAPYNINVNTICPGQVWTPLWDHTACLLQKIEPSYGGMDAKAIFDKITADKTPLGREQTADDIGNAVVFLASDEAKEITGQALNVDGGKIFC